MGESGERIPGKRIVGREGAEGTGVRRNFGRRGEHRVSGVSWARFAAAGGGQPAGCKHADGA